MPFWKRRTWRVEQNIAEEEDRIRELRRWDEPSPDEEEPTELIGFEEFMRGETRPTEAPREPTPREPIGWPWEWAGVTALTLEQMREEPLEQLTMPWRERIRQYQELPFTKQLGYEAPFWVGTAFLPTATALRAGLATKAGIAPKVARAGLLPAEAIEQAPAKAISKVAQMIKKPPTPILKFQHLYQPAMT